MKHSGCLKAVFEDYLVIGRSKDICQPMLLLRYIFITNCISRGCMVRLPSTTSRQLKKVRGLALC